MLLKLEKLRSPHVWTCVVKDIADHGSAGLPRAAVLNVMKRALNRMTSTEEQQGTKGSLSDDEDDDSRLEEMYDTPKHPTVSAQIQNDGSVVIDLNIPVGGIPLMFTFHFLALERKHIDVLESSLNDAKDEIAVLRDEVEKLRTENVLLQKSTAMISLRTDVPSPPNSVIPWTIVHASIEDPKKTVFSRSEDNKYVLIHQPGVYEVQARIVTNESSGNRALEVQLNDATVCMTYMGSNTGHWSAIQLRDFVKVEGEDPSRLSVKWTGNNQMLGNGRAAENLTHFSIVRLA